MNYKLDMDKLLDRKFDTTTHQIEALKDAVTAVLYMFEVGKIEITEDQYKAIADDDKKFFKRA